MGLNAAEDKYDSGGSKGFSGGDLSGEAKGSDEETEAERLARTFKYAGMVLPVFEVFSLLVKGATAYEEAKRERLGDEAYFAEKAAAEAKSAELDAARNEKGGDNFNALSGQNTDKHSKSRIATPVKPIPPAPLSTLGTPYTVGPMGTPTIKKKKLLGGDLLKRI